jgi:hypothetical protein
MAGHGMLAVVLGAGCTQTVFGSSSHCNAGAASGGVVSGGAVSNAEAISA